MPGVDNGLDAIKEFSRNFQTDKQEKQLPSKTPILHCEACKDFLRGK